jgi:uncharacterized RmlC-like cupin family protein
MPEQKPVVVRESSSLEVSGGQTEGMIRSNALVGLTPNICASRMIAKPHTASAVHHHGEQDTVVFSFSGYGTVVSEGGNKRQNLSPGDFALIPYVFQRLTTGKHEILIIMFPDSAFAEHQEVNESDEDVVWCIVRSGGEPCVVNIDGWGKS